MLNFCTIYYANYSAKGVALYYSLACVCRDFHMYIFAMDDDSFIMLRSLQLPHATIIPLMDLEVFYPALQGVKSSRNKGEYSWTCKGPALLYCFDKYKLDECTYLDADLYFFSDPKPLYEECPTADVMLMDHKYTPWYNLAETNGQYCAGYMYFKATNNGLKILKEWTEQCIEWCYGRHEPGRFGDQKYLDEFHEKYDNVHDLQHIGLCAPWNIQQYRVEQKQDGIYVSIDGKQDKLILYHFHFLNNQDFGEYNEFYLGPYKLSKEVMMCIYKPYLEELKCYTKQVDKLSYTSDVLASKVCPMTRWGYIWHWCKNVWKRNKIQWKRR